MPSTTTNYNLATYNATTDGVQLFSAYREAQSGVSSTSNMSLIDAALTSLQSQILGLSSGVSYAPSLATGTNAYQVLGITGISSYAVGKIILLSVDTPNTGDTTLDLNAIGYKTIYRVDNTGTPITLPSGLLIPGKNYPLVYNGTGWLIISDKVFDANRIIISDADGVESTDSSLLFDPANKSLSIGTPTLATASSSISQGSDDASVANILETFGASVASYISGIRARGTHLAATAVQAADVLFRLRGRGHDGTTIGATSGEIRYVASETFDATSHGTEIEIYTTPDASTTLTKALTITKDGSLNIESGKTYDINGSPHNHAIPSLVQHSQLIYLLGVGITGPDGPFESRLAVPYVGAGGTIEEIYVTANVAPSTTDFRFECLLNGTNNFNTATYMTLAVGNNSASRTTDFVTTSLAKDDYFTIYVTQTDVDVTDVVIHIRYKWTLTEV
jgi:hypothetical protein